MAGLFVCGDYWLGYSVLYAALRLNTGTSSFFLPGMGVGGGGCSLLYSELHIQNHRTQREDQLDAFFFFFLNSRLSEQTDDCLK